MQLEQVEQRCLNYLKQTSNPLTPFSRLLRHLREDESLSGFSEKELKDFLRHHDLFRVLEPTGLAATEEGRQLMEAAGLQTEELVVLETRLPTEGQLAEYLRSQLDTLADALRKAGADAQEKADMNRMKTFENLLGRVEVLRGRLDAM